MDTLCDMNPEPWRRTDALQLGSATAVTAENE